MQLGRQRFDLILGDEQAKANVNALLERDGRENAQTRLRQALSGTGLAAKLLLRPDPAISVAASQPTTAPANVSSWITGYGQVFDNVSPQALLNSGAAALLTCWGTGPVNARRAGESALKLATSPPLTPLDITRLIQARDASFQPGQSQGPITSPQNSPANSPPTAAGRITTTSACHSLWIIASSDRRSWYHFAVLDDADPQHPREMNFQW